jgi:hypothetical protein
MSFVASQTPLSSVKVLQATTVVIGKVAAATAGTEYSYSFPAGTKKFSTLSSLGGNLKVSFIAGDIAADVFWPVSRGNAYVEDSLTLAALTLYFTSDKPNDIIRVKSWS